MSRIKIFILLTTIIVVFSGLNFHCNLPESPDTPSNTKVNIIFRNSRFEQNSQTITDTVGNPIQMGLIVNLPEYIDSIQLTIKDDTGAAVFDTTIRSFKETQADTIWKVLSFSKVGDVTVLVIPYSTSVQLNQISASIHIIKKDGPEQQNDNHSPAWSIHTITASIYDTARYTLSLSQICSDIDGDIITYETIGTSLPYDTIINDQYQFIGKPSNTGLNIIKIIARDANGGNDTLKIELTVISSEIEDSQAPDITIFSPSKDSSISYTDSILVDIICTDPSGIDSVYAIFNDQMFFSNLNNGHYIIIIPGLVRNTFNTITIIASDASKYALKTTQTIHVKYIQKFTVTYLGNGNTLGTAPVDTNRYEPTEIVIVKSNSGNMSIEGFIFSGWNTASDNTGEHFAPGDTLIMSNRPITLYAQWTNNTIARHTVTFDPQGGSNVNSVTISHGETVTMPADPTRTGYSFTGWFKERDCINLWNFTTDVVTGPLILYANWKINSYTVKFNTQGGSSIEQIEVDYNETIPKPLNPTRTGFTFNDWYKERECINKWSFSTDRVNEQVTLYAKWTLNSYVVRFDPLGGSDVSQLEVDHGEKITKPLDPNRTGFTFNGWFKEKDCINLWDFISEIVTGPITLYAGWKLNSYAVSFDKQDGSSVSQVQVSHGATVQKPTDPTREGYSFEGWYKERSCINEWNFSTTVVTTPVTLYAKWTLNNYTVKFDKQDGSSLIQLIVNHGETVQKPADPSRTGFTFDAWYKERSCINKWNFSTDLVTGPLTLYANWKPVRCTVNFVTNGGSAVTSQTVDYGSLITKPNSTLSGLTLVGWYRDADFSTIWNFSSQVTSSMTLYAKWLVMDIDGNVYDTVRIGTQTWMVQNLKTTRYRDDTPIPIVSDSAAWANLITPACCWPYNWTSDGAIYGALYNGYAASNPQIAPNGWHVPSQAEFQQLVDYVSNDPKALMKVETLDEATNSSGFSGIFAPFRSATGEMGTSTETATWYTSSDGISFYISKSIPFPMAIPPFNMLNGFSIRCIKD